ncbi:MAG: DUF4139 domain-containing protein [Fimbriimonadaceae bacterium]|nr:DUF4139 domain-containing protein [Fimbriimonadaceae bacterium]
MLSLIAAFVVGTVPQAPQLEGYAFTTRLQTLVVFRDGFGFYLREGTAKLQAGWATTNLVPRALSGTLWVYPTNPADRIDTVVTTNDNLVEFDGPTDLKRALSDKVGLRLRVLSEARKTEGQLTAVLDQMMLLKGDDGSYTALEYARVDSVALANFPVRIKVRTQQPDGKAGVRLAYVQEGVHWEPSYVLEMLPGKRGRLTLRGTLLGLDEELKGTDVVFVVGAPVMVNRGSLDDLLAGYISGTVFAGNRPGALARSGESKAADAEKSGALSRGPRGGGGLGGGLQPLSSSESGELQYYSKPDFSLRPGERAMATIFEIDIPVSPLFEWDADGDRVTYLLTLENNSTQPLTAGPVFVVEDARPVGQERIEYTAKGGKAELRLAQGIGLKVERVEKEVKRGDPYKIGDQNFLAITLGGTLSLENLRKEPAEVRVTRTVEGKVLSVGSGGSVKNTVVQRTSPNASNTLEWKITVAPGTKTALDYSYETVVNLG